MPTATKKKPLASSAKPVGPKVPQNRPRAAGKGLGALPEWNLADLYPAHRRAGGEARPRPRRRRLRRLRGGLQGQARGARGGGGGASSPRRCKRYEALDDLLGRLGLLCRPGLCRQHHRSGAREILRRRAGAHHRRLAASPVLHARAQPLDDAALEARDGRSGARPLPALDRGRAQGKALSARGPRRATVPRKIGDRLSAPGTGCSTRRSPRCASRSSGKPLAIEPTLNLLQDAKRDEAQGRGGGAGEDLQGEPPRSSR